MNDLTGNFAGGLYGLALLSLIAAVVCAFFLHIPQPGLTERRRWPPLTPLSHDLLRTSEKEPVQYLALMADELTARASVQGNLDPLLLVAGGKVLVRRTHEILTVLSGKRFIFNLGHGIVPDRRRISVLP